MDEPTASLDGDTGHAVVGFVHDSLLNEHRCIVVVTHDNRIFEFATRILRMEDGRLTAHRGSKMRNTIIFSVAFIGILGGSVAAYLSGVTQPSLPPAFSPATNPYSNGIYANGILESDQPSGENTNVYPEVSGTVKQIPVAEGQDVKKGTVLLVLDDSIQRATAEQLESQSQAALTLLQELKAQPRKESLDVNEAQVVSAQAALRTAQDALDKQQAAYDLNPKSVSKDALDSAANAVATAKANLEVACKQRDLTKAGAWIYDINAQERQYNALYKSYLSATRAALQIHAARAQGRKSSGDQSHCRQLCVGAGRLRHLHARHDARAGAGKFGSSSERALLR